MQRHGGVKVGLGGAHLHRDADKLDHLAGVGPDDMGADHTVGSAVDHKLHQHPGVAAGQRRLHRAERGLVDIESLIAFARLHLGQADGPSARARRYLHQWALLGRSTHAPRQTDKAIKDSNLDYFCVGPVYATSTKPDYEPVGLDLVRYATRKAPVASIKSKPWFAIGGISMDNIDNVIEAGARRICVVRAITRASDPQDAADRLSRRLRAAWKADPAMEQYVFQALS